MLLHLRADVTQYTIWHRTNTAPILHRMPPGPLDIVQVDIDALAAHVEDMVRCYFQLDRQAELPAVLERLRSNINDPRWDRKITYQQAMCRHLQDDRAGARQELAKLGPISTNERDVDLLTLHLALNGESLGFLDKIKLYDRIISGSEERADLIHYKCARAFELLLVGETASAETAFSETVDWAHASEAEEPFDSHDDFWMCKALEGLAVIRRDRALFGEAAERLTKMLALEGEWTPSGRAHLYRSLGDIYRYAGIWEAGAAAYLQGEALGESEIQRVFRSECLLMLGRGAEALELLAAVDTRCFGVEESADYAFAYAYVATAMRDLDALAKAEALLTESKTPRTYFDRLRLHHLLAVTKVRASIMAGKPLPKRNRLLDLIGSFSRYIDIRPNFFGVGVNVNAMIEDSLAAKAARKDEKK